MSDAPIEAMSRDEIVKALEAEIKRRNEWYGLDNWPLVEVVDFFVLDHRDGDA